MGLDKQIFSHKIVNIFLSVLTNVLGAQKNRLILSTYNICFDCEIRKLIIPNLILRPAFVTDYISQW